MSSSMITGERRWASARKGGMTSLGKITVPKPINLPSLRVENHGLDPVDLVPKGTISWGSKPSSSHAWGSQALSPSNTDGIGSPNRISGRPSSSGSGTRPSTAGSDKSHEPTANAWGPSSRPSSASEVFSSNQTSMAAARPHSAETRPGSSQLSRFAEPMFENSAAWGAAGTAERLGVPSSKIDGFDLSSGDFPTLGTEKNTESHDQQGLRSVGQPASASGRLGTPKGRSEVSVTEVESADATTDKGSVNTWKRDSSPYIGEGVPPVADKWQREPQPYPNHNMPPQHFDPYHMIPVHNPPDGLWYRGPSSMPPYGPPGPPGGYPHESYGYYHPHPQHSARPLANSQTRTELNGPHSKHEGSCRPQMHDPYIRPVYPVRPGAYYRPAPYESFYGPPPAAFCNPSSQDASRMGVSNGPCIYNQYPSHNVHTHTGILQPRPSGQIPTNTPFVSEQVESVDYNTQRGPYKVLLKQHDSCEENDGVHKREHAPVSHTPYLERGKRPGVLGEDGFQVDCTNDEQVVTAKNAGYGEASFQSADSQGGCFEIPAGVSFRGDTDKAKTGKDILLKKQEDFPIPGGSQHMLSKRSPTLIDKIEGLNTKARNSDRLEEKLNAVEGEDARERNAAFAPETSDYKAQRAKMKDIAIQRAKQLQEEEEKRTNETKAKAFAKLEELNKRALAENSARAKQLHEERRTREHRAKVVAYVEDLNKLVLAPELKKLHGEEEMRTREQNADVSIKLEGNKQTLAESSPRNVASKALLPAPDSVTAHKSVVQKDVDNSDLGDRKTAPQVHDSSVTKHKHVVHQRKQNLVEKSLGDKIVSSGNSTGPQIHENTVASASSGESTLSKHDPNAASDLLVQRKKKSSRSSKNKHKLKVVQSTTPSSSTADENPAAVSAKSSMLKASESSVEVSSVQALASSENSVECQDHKVVGQGKPSSTEENHNRIHHQWKQQPSRQMPRNTEATRSIEKVKSNEALVWAPVRALNNNNNIEAGEEANCKTSNDAHSPSQRNDYETQNNRRNRRAEMERYVPKPIAKELSQQGNTQRPPFACVDQALSPGHHIDETELVCAKTSVPDVVAVGNGGCPVESKNGESKRNKRGKPQGLWRQRGLTETPNVHASDKALSLPSDPTDICQKPMEQESLQELETSSHKGMMKESDNCDVPISMEPPAGNSARAHGVTGQGKRQPYKGKDTEYSHSAFKGVTKGPDQELIGWSDTSTKPYASSGFRRHGHNNRLGKGHEMSRGGGNVREEDSDKQQNETVNSSRPKRSSHYEYQPVTSYSKRPNESFDEGSRVMGPRHHERGQSQSREPRHHEGNFYARNSGTAQVGGGGNGERRFGI